MYIAISYWVVGIIRIHRTHFVCIYHCRVGISVLWLQMIYLTIKKFVYMLCSVISTLLQIGTEVACASVYSAVCLVCAWMVLVVIAVVVSIAQEVHLAIATLILQ